MKHHLLAVMIPVLLASGTVNAVEIYNKEGSKFDLYGKIDARHQFSSYDGEDGDQSYTQFGLKGETQINHDIKAYGQWEYKMTARDAESQGGKRNKTRLAFVGIETAYGSIDYGRNYGVLYDIASYTDVLVGCGDFAITDNYMNQRSTGLLTYRNKDFFGLVDGLSFAMQYQGKNENGRKSDVSNEATKEIFLQNGDGWAVSSTYDVGYGIDFGAGYSISNRTNQQRNLNPGRQAQAWDIGAKYDLNNIYLAAVYSETKNMTPYGNDSDLKIAKKAQNIELAAQYQFDFGLRPSLAYVQSNGKDLIVSDEKTKNKDLLKYISIASYYNFNKNFYTYVDYKINLLKKDADFNKQNKINTKDVIGAGIVYQF
ncbi:porin [Candidatus Williamhamiltonella defendens]|uniref:porin n=1 Tax=Candidatus Williamhamiltonella defendens TaxID=138072 RepID=UPI00130D87BA|nr:porin [Candidatus Hamiltonella defensa]